MDKKMRELLALIEAKQIEAKGYMEGESKDVAKAAALLDEADALQEEFKVAKRLLETKKEDVPEDAVKVSKEEKAVKAFADAARNGFKTMNEGTAADGGYTVPEDIMTQINKYREAKSSLRDLVHVIPVKTLSGARTFKKRAQQTGFTKVGEGGKIGQKNTPQFERKEYKIEKYAGWLPVTNELFEDSDANIVGEITEWFGNESRVTGNKLILAQLDKKTDTVSISGLDDVKKVINVTLGQAFAPSSTFVTNDDGLHWLDTIKDNDGKYVLQPDPASPMKKILCAGAATVPVEVLPNDDLPTGASGIPVYIGDLYEAIKFFDRKQMEIKASDVAGAGDLNAYEEDLTLFRAIEREDVEVFDDQAYVRGFIAEPEDTSSTTDPSSTETPQG